jgi:hypothetical protein
LFMFCIDVIKFTERWEIFTVRWEKISHSAVIDTFPPMNEAANNKLF